MSIEDTMKRIRKQAEEMYNEKMKLLDEHKYEEIKRKVIDTKKAKQFTNIEDKAIISMEFIEDMQFLINIVDILEQKSIQDNETIKYYMNLLNGYHANGYQETESMNKVQMSSLYGEHKKIYKNVKISIDTSNGYYKDENVDVKITDKFVIIRNKETERFYNIKEIEYFSITQNESEVEQ